MLKSIMKAIGIVLLAIVILFGVLGVLVTGIIAWPIIIALVIFGLPFLIIGICVGKHKDK